MAKRLLKNATLDEDLQGLTVADLRREYLKIKGKYEKILNGYYCHACDKFLPSDNFYISKKWKSGVVPMCKDCLLKVAGNYNSRTKKYNETEKGIREALKICDLPFLYEVYNAAKDAISNPDGRNTFIFPRMVTMLVTLTQYKKYDGYEDSDPEDEPIEDDKEQKISKKKKDAAIRRFGTGFSESDYKFLEDEYADWTARYSCENKAQEVLFIRICCKELEIHKAQINGEDTKDLDKSLQELMSSLNIKPNQKDAKGLAESKSFGQLIEMWEEEQPIPEPDPEFKDVDGIMKYLKVWFGWIAKAVGLRNVYTDEYEKIVAQYGVKKGKEVEDVTSEEIYDSIFGKTE